MHLEWYRPSDSLFEPDVHYVHVIYLATFQSDNYDVFGGGLHWLRWV